MRQAVRATGLTHSCLDSATLCASSLRSVWSEASDTHSSPSAMKTNTSASPEEAGPMTCTAASCVSWLAATR